MSLYETVVNTGKPYLGPAAESFIARQCKSHLKIDPAALSRPHLKELAKWMEIGGGLIMDSAKAAEMAKKILALS